MLWREMRRYLVWEHTWHMSGVCWMISLNWSAYGGRTPKRAMYKANLITCGGKSRISQCQSIIWPNVTKNYIKMKKIGQSRGWVQKIRHWNGSLVRSRQKATPLVFFHSIESGPAWLCHPGETSSEWVSVALQTRLMSSNYFKRSFFFHDLFLPFHWPGPG